MSKSFQLDFQPSSDIFLSRCLQFSRLSVGLMSPPGSWCCDQFVTTCWSELALLLFNNWPFNICLLSHVITWFTWRCSSFRATGAVSIITCETYSCHLHVSINFRILLRSGYCSYFYLHFKNKSKHRAVSSHSAQSVHLMLMVDGSAVEIWWGAQVLERGSE